MTKEIFFVKEGQIFSKEKQKIKVPILDINQLEKNIQEKNFNEYIKNLDLIIKKKEIQISKVIENFEHIKSSFKEKKIKLEKIKEEEIFEFEENTFSLDILKEVLNQDYNREFEKILDLNKKILFNLKNKEKKELEIYLSKFEKIKKQLAELKEKREEFEISEIKPLTDKISELKNNKDKLERKISLLENKNENPLLLEILKNKEKLLDENEEIEFIVNKYKNEINLIKAKIQRITHEIKIGKERFFRPILFIFTLGLIYWTKFSTNKYRKSNLILKIDKINEKILSEENKLLENKHRIKQIESKIKKFHLENHKEEEKQEDELQKNKVNLNKIKKELEIEERKKIKEESKLNSYKKEIETLIDELKDVEIEINSLKENKEQLLDKKLEDIKKEYIQMIKEIEKIKNSLLEQKIINKGEFKFEL